MENMQNHCNHCKCCTIYKLPQRDNIMIQRMLAYKTQVKKYSTVDVDIMAGFPIKKVKKHFRPQTDPLFFSAQ